MKPFHALIDLLFPPKCPFCGHILPEKDPNGPHGPCPDCQKSLPWLYGPQSEQKPEFISLCASPLLYQEKVKESFHRYKFQGCKVYAIPYGALMAQCVQDHFDPSAIDLVTWAPLSAKRLRRRGYDQSRLLAEQVSCTLKLPFSPTLRKVRHTPAQSSLTGPDAAQRRANVLGAYALETPETLTGKRVLLIDDVITTGATLSECARVLRSAGAAEVFACTLAWAKGHK